MKDLTIDIIRTRFERPFVKISIDEHQKICDYLYSLDESYIERIEKLTRTADGAKKIHQYILSK